MPLLLFSFLVACRPGGGEDPTASPIAETATPTPVKATATVAPVTQEPTITQVAPTATPVDQPTVTPVGPTATPGATAAPTQVAMTPTVPGVPTLTPSRIEFESGAYTAFVAGSLAAGASDHYVLHAREAQLMWAIGPR